MDKAIMANSAIVLQGTDGTLFDIGDGVACLQLHSPANAISEAVRDIMEITIEEVENNFKGLVLSSKGPNFCVGGNLKYMLQLAEAGDWAAAQGESKKLHDTFMRMKYCSRPVIAAPFGNTLGGGVEMCLHCSGIQAVENIKMGLVEFRVGLIPGAGGVKEMIVRTLGNGSDRAASPGLEQVIVNLVQARVFNNAKDAARNGYIGKNDGISLEPENQLDDAKTRVLELYAAGYKKPEKATVKAVGEQGMAGVIGKWEKLWADGSISDYDFFIVRKLIYIMQGGSLEAGSIMDEKYLLSLEREVFISLLGQAKTQARMAHILKTGKPLRN